MNITDIELHEATSLAQASSLMARFSPDARLLAGGTDLLVDLKTNRVSVRHVVSINRIDRLRGILTDDSGLRIGALTTANQLASSPIVRERFAAILDATCNMAAVQVRNMATVGGNIASAIPSADLPPILLVMGASVVLWSGQGERTVPLESFFLAPRRSARKEDEVLTTILVPYPPARSGAAYARLSLREANACAVAGVAASVQLDHDSDRLEGRSQGRTIRDVRLALCAVAPTPKLVESAAKALIGEDVEEVCAGTSPRLAEAVAAAMDAAEPISDVRGSGDYRREMVGVLTRRALTTASQRAGEVSSCAVPAS